MATKKTPKRFSTRKTRKHKDSANVQKILYNFINDHYVFNAMMEASIQAIAKARAKRTIPKYKAIKVISVVVNDARRWYSRHVERLPRLRPEETQAIATRFYNRYEKDIEKLVKYYQ